MKNKLIALLILVISCTSFSKTIYSKYQTAPKYAEMDQAINQARMPTSSRVKNENNIKFLSASIKKYSDYPELSAAHFFLGRCNFKLENYRTAIKHYKKAIVLNPEIATKTPIDRFIKTLESKVARENNLIVGFSLLVSGVFAVLFVFFMSVKKSGLGLRKIGAVLVGVSLASLITLLWFSFSTASSADGFHGLYVTPVFVRSTIFETGSYPLVVLALCAIFTSVLTALATLGSAIIPRFRFLFPLLTAVIIGSAVSLLYYQYYALDADRTGTGSLKRISFPERPIDFHKDIPDEMIYLYDEKVKNLIIKAKLEAKLENQQ